LHTTFQIEKRKIQGVVVNLLGIYPIFHLLLLLQNFL
jgi:hypothetical protein